MTGVGAFKGGDDRCVEWRFKLVTISKIDVTLFLSASLPLFATYHSTPVGDLSEPHSSLAWSLNPVTAWSDIRSEIHVVRDFPVPDWNRHPLRQLFNEIVVDCYCEWNTVTGTWKQMRCFQVNFQILLNGFSNDSSQNNVARDEEVVIIWLLFPPSWSHNRKCVWFGFRSLVIIEIVCKLSRDVIWLNLWMDSEYNYAGEWVNGWMGEWLSAPRGGGGGGKWMNEWMENECWMGSQHFH